MFILYFNVYYIFLAKISRGIYKGLFTIGLMLTNKFSMGVFRPILLHRGIQEITQLPIPALNQWQDC